jgi:predicted phosphoribosyltransferase
MVFRDRKHAGQELARRLDHYRGKDDVVVLGLPRGGIPVAYEVARSLRAPLDVFVVRKLGVPGHSELAMGAIASGGVVVLNESIVRGLGIPRRAIEAVAEKEQHELERREERYRGARPLPDVRGRTVILVDDGLATGSTMKAAVKSMRRLGPVRIVVAVPVAPPETCDEVAAMVDEIVCLVTPDPFWAVGEWYQDFGQTSDEEVRELATPAEQPTP